MVIFGTWKCLGARTNATENGSGRSNKVYHFFFLKGRLDGCFSETKLLVPGIFKKEKNFICPSVEFGNSCMFVARY